MNNSQNHITPEHIDAYNRGQLSPAEEHAMEMAALHDPLLADALEGFEPHDAVSLSAKLIKRQKGGRLWKNMFWLVPVAVVAIFLWPSRNTSDSEPQNQIVEWSRVVSPESIAEPSKPEVIEMRQTDSSVQVTMSRTQSPGADKYLAVLPRNLKLDPIDPKKPDPVTIASAPLGAKPGPGKGERIYYISDYRVVDYSGRENPLRREELPGGLTADRERAGGLSPFEVHEDRQMAYAALLQRAIKAFAEGENDICAALMREVLKTFPDDLNALFYGGMAEMRRGNHLQALPWLEAAQNHPKQTFREEAAFYRAISMRAMNQPEGREMLESIAAGGGFYAARAKAELGAD